ncbi:MAG: hypothetical protein HDS35_01875 [Bacteroides sp.]|nr:hypothetical protein [Bacteroides sp.]
MEEKFLMKNVMSASVMPAPEGFSSRLDYWEIKTGRKAEKCAHEICNRPATEGAIATKAFSTDRTRYVYPACETCARRTEMLYIVSPLVPLS